MNADKRRFKYQLAALKFLLAGFFLLFPFSVFAKSLAKYRGDIRGAKLSIENLLAPDLEDNSFQNYLKLERDTIKKIRTDIPASEQIEWQNSTVETNNQWLLNRLNEFESAPPNDPKRERILTELSERLGALEARLYELENPSAASTRTKDEDKQKLAEILRREEFQKPEEKEESVFAKIWRRLMDWLENLLPRPAPSAPSAGVGYQSFSFVLQMLLYAVILGAIGFLIYRFAPFFINRYRAREKDKKGERVILGERLAADETAGNLFDEAERLARAGNLRGAIRKGYIALLCDLSERKIIGLSQHKTNRDYLRDVSKRDELYKNMRGLTNNYERHWYGFEDARGEDWEAFKTDYRKAVGSN